MNNDMNNRVRTPQDEARKREYYEKKRAEALAAAKKKSQRPYYIAVAAISLLIVICMVAAIVCFSLFSKVNAEQTYTLKIGSERSEATVVDGTVMINLDKLTSLLSLQKTGSAKSPKYTSESGDSIQFANGKDKALITVSGASVATDMVLSKKVSANSDGCVISLDTLSSIFSGITVTVSGETIKITRKTVPGNDGKLEKVNILNKTNEPLSRVLYLTDIMEDYEKYLNPTDRDAYLVLANKDNPLGESYAPTDLVTIADGIIYAGVANDQMREYAAKALEAMILEMRADECLNVFAYSGYRSYATQKEVFDRNLQNRIDAGESYEEAEQNTLADTAKPGYSEHQTGLCIDLYDNRRPPVENSGTNNSFTTNYWVKWLEENAWKFGFILRYPEGEEDITGYAYESWHFRYVGRYHAERITALDLTLEEYLELIND